MTNTMAMLRFAAQGSWGESVGPFHGESRFPHLRRIRWRNARKLRAHVVDNVEIAVRTIVIRQADIGTHRPRVRSIELNQACKSQEPSEGIISLHARQHHGKVSIRQRQAKSVPGLGSGDRKLRGWTIISPCAEFIPSGTPVTVSLDLEAGTSLMRSGARVVRTVGTDCMGIQFENLGRKESVRLQEFLLPLILAAS